MFSSIDRFKGTYRKRQKKQNFRQQPVPRAVPLKSSQWQSQIHVEQQLNFQNNYNNYR